MAAAGGSWNKGRFVPAKGGSAALSRQVTVEGITYDSATSARRDLNDRIQRALFRDNQDLAMRLMDAFSTLPYD